MFFAANVPKIPNGGWFPLVVAFVLVVQMTTWRRGSDSSSRPGFGEPRLRSNASSRRPPSRRASACRAPPCTCSRTPARHRRHMLINLEHHKVLHERVLVVVVQVSGRRHDRPGQPSLVVE